MRAFRGDAGAVYIFPIAPRTMTTRPFDTVLCSTGEVSSDGSDMLSDTVGTNHSLARTLTRVLKKRGTRWSLVVAPLQKRHNECERNCAAHAS